LLCINNGALNNMVTVKGYFFWIIIYFSISKHLILVICLRKNINPYHLIIIDCCLPAALQEKMGFNQDESE